jgi:tRNA modification GTPase
MDQHTSLAGDTIAAIATAPGRGGIGIVRISGPLALTIGQSICAQTLIPRQAKYCQFHEADNTAVLDAGIALYFPSPGSFTGEDVVELQGHGGPVVLDLLLQACCHQGARLARAGEFSERAFLNDKLDLAQAEAIADLINSTTQSAARGALRSLQGEFSKAVNTLMQKIISLRIYVEAAIDFPEEEIDFIAEGEVAKQLEKIHNLLIAVVNSAKQGSLLREGMKLVIAGKPNAGKSSLLNALSGQDSAIVTAIEGTTRDVLREHIQIDGMPLHIVDTAGLRASDDEIEQEGIRRAWQEMATADRILLVIDSTRPQDREAEADIIWPELHQHLPESIPITIIHNKCDLADLQPASEEHRDSCIITLSAKTGVGMPLLRDHLKRAVGFDAETSPPFLARRRHLEALNQAMDYLKHGQAQLRETGAAELLAEDLRQCHNCLGEITGVMTSDELLGEIFSGFCIGK